MQMLWVLHQEQGQSTWTPLLDGRAEQGLRPSFSFLCFSCQSGATCSLIPDQGLCGSCLSQTEAPEAGAGGTASFRSIAAWGLGVPASSG